MADPNTAADRLRRILHVLPAAAREGGVALEEAAAALDVEPATVLRDLEEVTARSLYLPPGPADALQIRITPERIHVWSTGGFTRPVKLLPREALALGMGLRARVAAEGGPGERERADALRRRLEAHLVTAPPEGWEAHFEPAGDEGEDDAASDVQRLPGAVFEAARGRRPLRFRYLKPGAAEAERRTVHPWSVVRAEGHWYVLGPDPDAAPDGERGDASGPDGDPAGRADLRAFRLDRMLEAEVGDGCFEVPEGFDPSAWVDRGRLFRADDAMEVRVRYSPRIARWIAEKPWAGEVAGSEERPDGSLVVRHRVADPRWIVRYVLQYGPDAEVLEPEWARARVRERAEGLADSIVRRSVRRGSGG